MVSTLTPQLRDGELGESKADFPADRRSTGRKGGKSQAIGNFPEEVKSGWEERQEEAFLGNGMGEGRHRGGN